MAISEGHVACLRVITDGCSEQVNALFRVYALTREYIEAVLYFDLCAISSCLVVWYSVLGPGCSE